MRTLLRVTSMLALAIVPLRASAGVEAGLGPVDEIDGNTSGIVTLSHLTGHRHPFEFMLGYLDERDMTASGPVPGTWFASASKRFTWQGWFAQGGIAWAGADNEVLSKHVQFHTGAGWRHEPWTVSLRHLSNGNTGGRNRGETFLLVQYAF